MNRRDFDDVVQYASLLIVGAMLVAALLYMIFGPDVPGFVK